MREKSNGADQPARTGDEVAITRPWLSSAWAATYLGRPVISVEVSNPRLGTARVARSWLGARPLSTRQPERVVAPFQLMYTVVVLPDVDAAASGGLAGWPCQLNL